MKRIFILLLTAASFASCQKETTGGDVTAPAQEAEKTSLNVIYATADTMQQKLDVYLPAGRTTTETKLLVLIHGGAWTAGDKSDFATFIPVFKQRLPGYAIININYRLAAYPASNAFPVQEADVKAAFAFIMGKAAEYKFNGAKVTVLGASAGAHLALLQAYKNPTPKLAAVVDMFGPTDMAGMYNFYTGINQFGISLLMSGTPATNAALYQSSSPINYVSAQSPPTLILHGGVDDVVPIGQSNALKSKLQTAGVPVQMIVYPTESHGWGGANLADSFDKMVAFLTTYNP